MKIILILILVMSCCSPALGKTPVPHELMASANGFSAVISDGFEVEVQRKYMKVHIGAKDQWDAKSSYLVFISFEGRGGSNTFIQWAGLFSSTSKEIFSEEYIAMNTHKFNKFYLIDFIEIGRKMWRVLDVDEAVEKTAVIKIPYTFWAPNDPGCCPSGKGFIHIQFKNGQIVLD